MALHHVAVDVHLRLVVYGAEVEKNLLAVPLRRNGYFTLIPYAVDEIHVLYSRQLALGAERNGNLLVELVGFVQVAFYTGFAEIEVEVPRSVQVHPRGALKLRAGILGAGRSGRPKR